MAINKVIYNGDTLVDLTGLTSTADTTIEGYTGVSADGATYTGTLGDATEEKSGLMSADDKIKLDGLDDNNFLYKSSDSYSSGEVGYYQAADQDGKNSGCILIESSDPAIEEQKIGPSIQLNGVDYTSDPGSFILSSTNGEDLYSLIGNDSGSLTWNNQEVLTEYSNYAGSSEPGGAATSANKLNRSGGSATQPVYFDKGVPVATDTSLTDYLPIAGGTFAAGSIELDKSDTTENIIIRGGGTESTDGARLVLYGKDHANYPGCFYIGSTDGTTRYDLIGNKDGNLTWNGNDVITSAGGTFGSGNIIFNKADSTSSVVFRGGGDSIGDGAKLELGGINDSNGGRFVLHSSDGTNSYALVGGTDGSLKWDGNNILTSAGGTITGSISKTGKSSSWRTGRDNAPFCTTAETTPTSTDYIPCWSAKSYEGSWDCGPQGGTLNISYVPDTNYSAGTNKRTAAYAFQNDGTFVANTFSGSLSGNADTATTATSANKINTDAGSTTQPVYFSGGVPVATSTSLTDYIPKAGGTLASGSDYFIQPDNTGNISFTAGTSNSINVGPRLMLYGTGYSSNSGNFCLSSATGSSSTSLIGTSAGGLTWSGNTVFTSGSNPVTDGTVLRLFRFSVKYGYTTTLTGSTAMTGIMFINRSASASGVYCFTGYGRYYALPVYVGSGFDSVLTVTYGSDGKTLSVALTGSSTAYCEFWVTNAATITSSTAATTT